jgi:anti-sigma B factor antagonist
MSLQVNKRQVGQVMLLEVNGQLTSDFAGQLQSVLGHMAAEGRKEVLIDCRGLGKVDSRGLGVLVRGSVSTAQRGGRFKLASPPRQLSELIELTRLTPVLECYDDIGVALNSF